MIPFLVYILIKKYRKHRQANFYSPVCKFSCIYYQIIFLSLLIMLFALVPLLSKSQDRQLHYKIVQGGGEIGWMRLEKATSGNRSILLLTSEIKTRIIFTIRVCAKETAAFENGKLIHSTQFRKTNGDVKVNKQTRLVANKYEVEENGRKQTLSITNISINLLSLYFQEPVGIKMLYCDKYECLVKVTKTEDGGYKVKFPDDNSNIFYYSGGICTKVKIEHTFYTATIIINP